jgi:hypothetical protein
MHKLKIWKSDIQDGRLPPVCVVCGADTEHTKTVNLSWNPSWVGRLWLFGLLPGILGALLTPRKCTVPLPVCARHKGHWTVWQVVIWSGIALAIGIGCLGAYIESAHDKTLGDNILMSGVGLLAFMALATVFISDRGVRADQITDQTITLKGVSDKFVQAMGQNQGRTVLAGGVGLETAKFFQAGYGRQAES